VQDSKAGVAASVTPSPPLLLLRLLLLLLPMDPHCRAMEPRADNGIDPARPTFVPVPRDDIG